MCSVVCYIVNIMLIVDKTLNIIKILINGDFLSIINDIIS